MTDPLLDSVVTRARKQAYKRHSAAYRWLREHHAKLAPVFAAKQPPWREIAAELTAGGVQGDRGKPLTARSLASIWARVCRDTAVAEAKQQMAQQARRLQPSRQSTDWRPVPVQPAAARLPPRFPAQDQAGDSRYVHLSDHARETLESLDRQLTHRDRFVNPPKRGS